MPKLLNHNIILPKYLEIVKEKGSSFNFSAQGGRGKEKNCKPAEKIAAGSEGEAEGGCGGNSASPEPKRSPAALLAKSRESQKSFLYLLKEKRNCARKSKIEKKTFLRNSERQRAAAGRSVNFVQNRFGFGQTIAPVSNFQEFCRLIQPREARQRTETLARRARRGSPSAGSKSLAILSICFAQLKINKTIL